MGGILRADFEGLRFEQVQGYRISVTYRKDLGFEGRFFVYLWDVVDAEKAFKQPVEVSKGDKELRGTLTLSDGGAVTYTFPDIKLLSAEVGATRAHRYRLIEFQYEQDVTDREPGVEIALENKRNQKLTKGKLQSDYDYKLGQSPEPLLGFRARQAPTGSNVFRFSTLRNSDNSFLEKALELNKNRIAGQAESFTVDTTQLKLELTEENLISLSVDESYGLFLDVPLPGLAEFLLKHDESTLGRVPPRDFTPADLIHHDVEGMRQLYPKGYTVETATIMLHPGEYRDAKFT